MNQLDSFAKYSKFSEKSKRQIIKVASVTLQTKKQCKLGVPTLEHAHG